MSAPHLLPTDEPFEDAPPPFDDEDALPEEVPPPGPPEAPPLIPDVLDPTPPTSEQAVARVSRDLVTMATALQITDPASFDEAGRFLTALKTKARQVEDFWGDDIERAHATWKGLTAKRAQYLDPLKQAIVIVSANYSSFAKEARLAAERERARREREAQADEKARLEAEAAARLADADTLLVAASVAPTPEEATLFAAQAEDAVTEASRLRQDAATTPGPVLPLQPVVTLPKGVSVRQHWTYRLDDKMALIRAVVGGTVSAEAIEESSRYLNARARADKDTVTIPGVTFYDAGSVAHRRPR